MEQRIIDALNSANYPSKGNVFATINDVSPSTGYKTYVALLTQTGTNAPVATILKNTIGDIVWTRHQPGGIGAITYLGTLAGAFTSNKTVIVCPFVYNAAFNGIDAITVTSTDVITIGNAGIIVDGDLNKTAIEIRVYA